MGGWTVTDATATIWKGSTSTRTATRNGGAWNTATMAARATNVCQRRVTVASAKSANAKSVDVKKTVAKDAMSKFL